jgi:hypothetical protein
VEGLRIPSRHVEESEIVIEKTFCIIGFCGISFGVVGRGNVDAYTKTFGFSLDDATQNDEEYAGYAEAVGGGG